MSRPVPALCAGARGDAAGWFAGTISSGPGRARPAASKIIFANQLRGVCVLAVLFVHYTIVATYLRRDVAWVIGAPILRVQVFDILPYVYPAWFDLGKFGVGMFFLISGFVIPFSLRGTSVRGFLIARALRIYPTLWVALLAEGGAVAASSAFWHVPSAYGLRSYVLNGLLIGDLFDLQSVDWVSWTLYIEIKFYLLAAVLCPLLIKYRTWPLVGVAAGGLASNILWANGLARVPEQLITETTFVGFIMVGTLFHYRIQAAISSGRFWLCLAALLALFCASYSLGPTRTALPVLERSLFTFLSTVLVFAACYAMRARFRRNRMLDAAAAISYPLYLVHAVFGFVLLNFFCTAWNVPFAAAALSAAMGSVILATAIHFSIEVPTIRLGSSFRLRSSTEARASYVGAGR